MRTILLAWLSTAGLAQASEPVLPQLLAEAPAVYPAEALARGQSATVLLELDIDDVGSILEARVVRAAGAGFDEAALAAIKAYAFAPARDAEGNRVPATIRFEIVFTPDDAAVISVEGRVRLAGERRLLEGVEVLAESPDGRRAGSITSPDGTFELAGLEPGPWRLTATGPDLLPSVAEIETGPGKVVTVTLYARPVGDGLGEMTDIVDVVGYRTEPEIGERRIDQDELRVLPGSSGDLVRTIQNLPGVARPPFNLGQLLIRGTGPDESIFTLERSLSQISSSPGSSPSANRLNAEIGH